MPFCDNTRLSILFFILWGSSSLAAEYSSNMKNCLHKQVEISEPDITVSQLIKNCKAILAQEKTLNPAELSNIQQRIAREKSTLDNPNVITSHKRNYFLPISYVSEPNDAPFRELLTDKPLDNLEAKFQLSFKAPIVANIFNETDALFFGFTIQSYWQMYNTELSSPFRETNYQPEIFYTFVNDWKLGNWSNPVIMFGFEHQSNGRTQQFSRSWNRLYANFVFEKENWAISFRPWFRLKEDEKLDPNQPDGDDNPDIEKYMGHFELTTIYQWDDQNISFMFRNNLRSTNRGALQLDWTYPMGKRFKGYLQYFNGYGESLIDYNQSIERFGLGILLTDFF